MSTEAVKQFLQKVSEDRELQQELTQALNSENQQQATVELANKRGYQCSANELWIELKNAQNKFQAKLDSGEISEEQLEAIAGGKDGARTSGAIIAFATLASAAIDKWVSD